MNNVISEFSKKQSLTLGAAGFFVGVILTSLFFILSENKKVLSPSTDRAAADQEGSLHSSEITSRGNDRVVADDQAAGSVVRLSSVTLGASSWVAIHEETDGVLGNILGAVRFDQGTSQGQIALLRPTQPDERYYVRLYRDNGDREFNVELDRAIVNAASVPIGDTFRTSK